MKFFAITILALATGTLAMPKAVKEVKEVKEVKVVKEKGQKPPKPDRPINNNNNNNNQQIQCGNDQSLYCCYNEGNKKNDVTCASFSNGGLGGICNGIQVCCQNNNGKQGCNVGNGGGKVTIKDEPYEFGLFQAI